MLDPALDKIKDRLLEMSRLVETAIIQAVESLAEENPALAKAVIERDKQINQLELYIDDEVSRLLATQQPVAKDLRKLIAAMKISGDLERMGDLAENIAKVTMELKESNLTLFKKLEDITKMAEITQRMVHNAIQSFVDENVKLAKSIAEMDNQVDRLYNSLIDELVEYIPEHTENTEVALKLCFVTRHLERIADHTTNLSESIVYIETGEIEDLN